MLSLRQGLAAGALLLGVVAAFARPDSGSRVTVEVAELERLVQQTEDHVTPRDLADRIIAGRSDFRLIDLRLPAEYAAYHIPNAENVPLAELSAAALLRNETIILYSEGGIHAAQAWLLLRAKGYARSYSLLNGLDGWKDEVLYPLRPSDASPESQAAFAAAIEVAKHFGGAPREAAQSGSAALSALGAPTAGAASAGAPAGTPGIAPPAMPQGRAPVAKAKKKEGC